MGRIGVFPGYAVKAALAGVASVICACQGPSGTTDGVGPAEVAPPPQPLPPIGDPRLARIDLPQGFHIRVYAAGVAGARSLSLGAEGTLFVGTRSQGRVYALRDEDGDHKAERVVTLARGLNSPNGVAFRDGDLYVAEISRILRYPDIEANLEDPPRPEIVNDGFPTDGHHGWKFIRFGPDGLLYVPVGAPCNTCDAGDPYASIGRLDPGGGFTILARGVRNTVGFDWHPETGELWFTENGRDWLGDDSPPDELNRLGAEGEHFGYPYCHGRDIADPGSAPGAGAASSSRRCRISALTWRPWECASIRAPCSPRSTATRSSSPNTVPGTAAARSATASCWYAWRATRRSATRPSPKAGSRGSRAGAGLWTSSSCPTAPCCSPTTRPT